MTPLAIPDNAVAVTPDDTNNLSNLNTVGIYVGGTGTVKVDLAGGGTVTYSAVPVGTTLWGRFTKVYAAGTTATLMLQLIAS